MTGGAWVGVNDHSSCHRLLGYEWHRRLICVATAFCLQPDVRQGAGWDILIENQAL